MILLATVHRIVSQYRIVLTEKWHRPFCYLELVKFFLSGILNKLDITNLYHEFLALPFLIFNNLNLKFHFLT